MHESVPTAHRFVGESWAESKKDQVHNMKIKLTSLAVLAISVLLFSACAKKKKFSGEFVGDASGLFEGNYPNAPVDATEENQGAVAVIKQDGDSVTTEVTNSNILKGCKLTGKVNPDGKVYVSGGTCEAKVKGQTRSVYFSEGNVALDEAGTTVTIQLTGIVTGERFKYKFQGKKK